MYGRGGLGGWYDPIVDLGTQVVEGAIDEGAQYIKGQILPDGSSDAYGGAVAADYRGRRWCPGRPTAAAIDAVRRYATEGELDPLVQHWNQPGGADVYGDFFTVHPDELGYNFWGRADCKHSHPNGRQMQTYFDSLVRKYASASTSAAGNGGGGNGGNGGGFPGVDLSGEYSVGGLSPGLLLLGGVALWAVMRGSR